MRLLLSFEQEEGYGQSMLCVQLSGIDGFEAQLDETLGQSMFMPDVLGTRYTYVLRPQSDHELELVVGQVAEIVAELPTALAQTEDA